MMTNQPRSCRLSRRAVLRALTLVAASTTILSATTANASADVAADMLTELQNAGVPGVTVTVATPPAATAADAAAFQNNPGGTYTSLTPEGLLSPDPTTPQPVATVAFGPSSVTRWPGFIQAPGIDFWSTIEDASVPVWRLDIMSAMKHAISGSAALTGVAMQPLMPNWPGTGPDLYLTPPDAPDYPAAASPQTMSPDAAQQAVKAGLPPTSATADVSVVDFAGGQRRLTVSVSRAADQTAVTSFSALVGYALEQQQALNENGANIGSVVLRMANPLTGLPVATFAGDASWGQSFGWYAPELAPFAPGPPTTPVDPVANATGTASDIQANSNDLIQQPLP
jgi:hypothetical protein